MDDAKVAVNRQREAAEARNLAAPRPIPDFVSDY
jgi:hypothetical protein